jgi:hypothetical protein
MFQDQGRDQLRRYYFESWRKYRAGEALNPFEQSIAQVIAQHPEYHSVFDQPDKFLDKDYLPEMGMTNPFLHLGMHLGIQEQLSTQRPQGILRIYQEMLTKIGDAHEVEHHMMDCLAESLWQAQRSGTAPDESAYLECLENSAASGK